MSIYHATSLPFRNEAPRTSPFPGWLQRLATWLHDSLQTAREERIVAELPDHLRYDIGALDCIPSRVSSLQVQGSYQERLEAQWGRGA